MYWYRFVGVFLGKAIYDRQLVDVNFSTTLFKQVFGKHVDIDDLRVCDPTLVKSMEWMLENEVDGILFEEFLQHITVNEAVSQQLLFPVSLSVTPQEQAFLISIILKA